MKKGNVLVLLVMLCCLGAVPAAGFDGTDYKVIKQQAEEGKPDAQMKLGVMYISGIGVAKDKKEGVKWYQKSADQGYPPGQWNMAFVHVKGEVVPQDFAKALELFKKAAEKGYAPAQYDLGMMYLQGLATKADPDQAEIWFKRAAAQDNRDAKKILKELAANAEKASVDQK